MRSWDLKVIRFVDYKHFPRDFFVLSDTSNGVLKLTFEKKGNEKSMSVTGSPPTFLPDM